MTMRKVITVDGLAASGKSALSRALAERIGFTHFSSGLLYRALGYLALVGGVDLEDGSALVTLLRRQELGMVLQGSKALITVNGAPLDPSADLHVPQVSDAGSRAGRHPSVRALLVDVQRGVFPGLSLVAEGRDMGTVIFPGAEIKFFIEASVEVRVRRRLAQFGGDFGGGSMPNPMEQQIEMEIMERDHRDRTREVAPTVPASGAIIIDNSGPSLTQIVETMYHAAHSRGVV